MPVVPRNVGAFQHAWAPLESQLIAKAEHRRIISQILFRCIMLAVIGL